MKIEDIPITYNHKYGIRYDSRFHEYDEWAVRTVAHTQMFKMLLENTGKGTDARWLDVGCGTGHLLSLIPDAVRTGLDLSPGMIVQAKKKNPTVPIIEGNYLDSSLFASKSFDVITETGLGYTYVDSFDQWEDTIKNYHSWLDENGVCFVSLATLDLICKWAGKATPNLPYDLGKDFEGGNIRISGFEWTWNESEGFFHRMRVPHPQVLLDLFGKYFNELHIVNYPPWYEGLIAFKQKQDPKLIEQIIEKMSQLAEETKNFRPAPTDPRSLIRKSLSKVKQRIKHAVSRW